MNNPMIFVTGGRFPRALPQPPRFATGSSPNAVPTGVATLRYNQ